MNDYKEYTILSAANSTGAGKAVLADDFKTAVLSFATDGGGTANLTVKFQGSIQESAPDFGSAQSVTNHWDYIEVIDLQDGTPIDGDTGITLAGADDYRTLEANVGHLRWICARITARSAGTLTIKARLATE